MNKPLSFLCLVALTSCGNPDGEKKEIEEKCEYHDIFLPYKPLKPNDVVRAKRNFSQAIQMGADSFDGYCHFSNEIGDQFCLYSVEKELSVGGGIETCFDENKRKVTRLNYDE